MESIAPKIGCMTPPILRKRVRQAERDQGLRSGLTSDKRERLKALERESAILPSLRCFSPRPVRPQTEVMMLFVNGHRAEHRIEPICALLPIAPSTHYEHKAREVDPRRLRY